MAIIFLLNRPMFFKPTYDLSERHVSALKSIVILTYLNSVGLLLLVQSNFITGTKL